MAVVPSTGHRAARPLSIFDLHAAVFADHRDLIGSVSGMPAPIKPSRSSALDAREPMWIVALVIDPNIDRPTTAEVPRRVHASSVRHSVDARILTAYSRNAEVDTTTVTSKGQVTIPKDMRRRFGIRQGSRVELAGDHLELRVVSRTAEAKPSGFGLLKSKRRTVPADLDPAWLIRR